MKIFDLALFEKIDFEAVCSDFYYIATSRFGKNLSLAIFDPEGVTLGQKVTNICWSPIVNHYSDKVSSCWSQNCGHCDHKRKANFHRQTLRKCKKMSSSPILSLMESLYVNKPLILIKALLSNTIVVKFHGTGVKIVATVTTAHCL